MDIIHTILLVALGLWLLTRILAYLRFHSSVAPYFAGKHVWIIGASSGLGEEMVTQLAPTGAILYISSRKTEVLEALKKQTIAKYPSAQISIFPLDVTDEGAIEATYEAIKRIRDVDVVVYNSGINQENVLTHDLSPKQALNVLNTNFVGAVHVIQRVLVDMKRRKSGHIVTVSSLAAHRGLPESGVYGASKAAMSNYIEALRVEMQHLYPAIALTDIQPGFVRTPILKSVKYDVPLVMETPRAVELMLKATKERRPFYSFPVPLYYLQVASHLMPCWLYDFVIGQAAKNKRA